MVLNHFTLKSYTLSLLALLATSSTQALQNIPIVSIVVQWVGKEIYYVT